MCRVVTFHPVRWLRRIGLGPWECSFRFGGHKRERVADADAYPQPFALRAELIDGGRPRVRHKNSALYCALAGITGILGHPDNAGRIHRRTDPSQAADVAQLGRMRTPNSNCFASHQF
jgi:hypothetical protein